MNELQNLETFVHVADAGSFTGAARALGIRQPTVSRRIAELEAHLGVPLVRRSTRSLDLTESGLRYLEHAREVLSAMTRAREAVVREGPLGGTLRIAAPVSLATTWLAPQLPEFLASHPDLDLQLELSEEHIDLVARHIDLALRVGGPDAATLTGRRLRPVHRWLVASPAWLAAHGPIEDVSQLAEHTGLVFSPPNRPQSAWPLRTGFLSPARVVTASNGLFLAELVIRGVGVGLLPDWAAEDHLARGRLVRLLPEVTAVPLSMWLVWPDHHYQRAAARAFIAWLSDRQA
jgi:DNA-binding transcriptional LysR family regulator